MGKQAVFEGGRESVNPFVNHDAQGSFAFCACLRADQTGRRMPGAFRRHLAQSRWMVGRGFDHGRHSVASRPPACSRDLPLSRLISRGRDSRSSQHWQPAEYRDDIDSEIRPKKETKIRNHQTFPTKSILLILSQSAWRNMRSSWRQIRHWHQK
jgi:hypothetical protein